MADTSTPFAVPPGKPPSHPFKRGIRPSAAERRARVKQISQLIAKGMEPIEAVEELAATWGVVDPVTKRRYLDAYWKRSERADGKTVEEMARIAVQQRQAVMRHAWTLNPPDFDAIHRALDGIAKIQGIYQPEAKETLQAALAPILARIVDSLRRRISDPEVLRLVIDDILGSVDVGWASATTVQPAALPEVVTVEAKKADGKGSVNGKNGTNGAHGPTP